MLWQMCFLLQNHRPTECQLSNNNAGCDNNWYGEDEVDDNDGDFDDDDDDNNDDDDDDDDSDDDDDDDDAGRAVSQQAAMREILPEVSLTWSFQMRQHLQNLLRSLSG